MIGDTDRAAIDERRNRLRDSIEPATLRPAGFNQPLSAGNVTTPTMVLTGELDYRTPMSETESFTPPSSCAASTPRSCAYRRQRMAPWQDPAI